MNLKNIEKKMPIFVYKVYYFIWRNTLFKYHNMKRKTKLKKFNKTVVKNIFYEGIKYSMSINPKNGYVDEEIFLKNVYEPEVLSFFKKKINKDDTFLDIGSNIGQHAIFVSKIVGKKGKVIAFEPIKRLYEQIKHNKSINNMDNLTIINKACGLKKELKEIFVNFDNAGGSSIKIKHKNYEIELIKISKLDDLVKDKVDFIKIDVEGFEPEVIFGAKNIIKNYHPKIFLEYTPECYRDKGKSMFKFLDGEGYNLIDFRSGKRIRDYNKFIKNFKFRQENLYFEYNQKKIKSL